MNKIIAANWKMNLVYSEAKDLLENISEIKSENEIYVFPSYIYLDLANKILGDTNVKVGAQNVFYENKGAFTGEVSPEQLKSMGISYAIIGHSERRKYFGDTDEIVNKKLLSCISNNIRPILCIGEPDEIRQNKTYEAYLYNQLKLALNGVSVNDVENIIIAYEPVWAIGTGNTMNYSDIKRSGEFIYNTIKVIYPDIKIIPRILYGGSVNSSNSNEILNTKFIDGLLIGGASLKFEELSKIIEEI